MPYWDDCDVIGKMGYDHRIATIKNWNFRIYGLTRALRNGTMHDFVCLLEGTGLKLEGYSWILHTHTGTTSYDTIYLFMYMYI